MKRYATYLFDVDGTLIDTAELIYHCFLHTCRNFAGIEIDRDLVMHHIGLSFEKQIRTYLPQVTDEEIPGIFEKHMAFQNDNYRTFLRGFDGVIEMLSELRNRGAKLGVVTSRRKESLLPYLEETGIHDFFTVLISPEDTVEHKPSGVPVIRAMELLEAEPSSTIYIGDSKFDIEAGFNAGCDTAFVEWSMITAESCHVKPTYVISSPSDLL